MSYPKLSDFSQPITFQYQPVEPTGDPNAFYLTKQGALLSQLFGTTNPYTVNTLANDPTITNSPLTNYYKLMNRQITDEEQQQNSWQNQYLKPGMELLSGLSTLGNMWLGMKQYGIAKKQLGMAEDQWNMTKNELGRIRTLRDHLTQSYMNGE